MPLIPCHPIKLNSPNYHVNHLICIYIHIYNYTYAGRYGVCFNPVFRPTSSNPRLPPFLSARPDFGVWECHSQTGTVLRQVKLTPPEVSVLEPFPMSTDQKAAPHPLLELGELHVFGKAIVTATQCKRYVYIYL